MLSENAGALAKLDAASLGDTGCDFSEDEPKPDDRRRSRDSLPAAAAGLKPTKTEASQRDYSDPETFEGIPEYDDQYDELNGEVGAIALTVRGKPDLECC